MPCAGLSSNPARVGNDRSRDKASKRAASEYATRTSCAMNRPSAVRKAIVFMVVPEMNGNRTVTAAQPGGGGDFSADAAIECEP
jgi:hypothetical protein